MLRLLPSHAPGVTASDLTRQLADSGYQVTKRTVERDLQELSRQFGICCNDKSIPWGWYLLSSARTELGSIDLCEAVSLTLAESVLRQMLPPSMLSTFEPKFELARKKLSAIEKLPLAQWSKKVRYVPDTLPLRPAKIDPQVLNAVQSALVTGKQLLVCYEPFRSKPKDLRLQPTAIIQRGPTTYLIATVFDYSEIRRFPLHRIKTAGILEEAINHSAEHSIDDLIASGLMEFGDAKPIKLEAHLDENLATYLSETPLSDDQKIRYRDDRWHLTATVRHTWQLEFWLLSQSPNITVLKPTVLRETIQHRLQTALHNYLKLQSPHSIKL